MAEIFWEFKIEGLPWVIEELHLATQGRTDWLVLKRDGEWKLRFSDPNPDDAVRIEDLNNRVEGIFRKFREKKEQAKTQASTILDLLNCIAFLVGSTSRKLKLGMASYFDGEERTDYLEIIETVEIADHVSVWAMDKDGNIVERQPSAQIQSLLRLSEQSPDVAEMMRYMQQYGMHDWVGMYKIYEQLRKKLGNDDKLIKKLSTTKAQSDRFTRTANHPLASGDLARHAVSKEPPPPDPMTPEEGQAYLKSLLLRYFSLDIHVPGGNYGTTP